MPLDSRIMDMIRRAKAEHKDDLRLEYKSAPNFEPDCEDTDNIPWPSSDIGYSARQARRAEYSRHLQQALIDIVNLGLDADMHVARDDAPLVADLLRELATTLDCLFEMDLAEAMRPKPRVRVPARTSSGNVIPFPGGRRSSHTH